MLIEESRNKSDTWNVAQGYTQLKILSLLVEMDSLVKTAIYGSDHIEDSIMMPPEIKTSLRLEALYRLIDDIKLVIENCKFAIKKTSQEKLSEMIINIEEVENYTQGLEDLKTNHQTGQKRREINEAHFYNVLSCLRAIKEELPFILNDSNLIFPASEETDLDRVRKELVEGG